MKLRKRVCVIIDAYSTARLLAPAFATLGHASVHIQTLPKLSPLQQSEFRPEDFVDRIVYDGDLEALCAYLARNHPAITCLVPGIESGVMLADQLSERFDLVTNGTPHSLARRDKAIMAETVAREGIPTIPHLRSADLEELCRWHRSRGGGMVVMKPIASSGTFGFNICADEPDLRETFRRLHRSRDVFGNVIDEVLLQPLVDGQEYSVNCVSHDGRHYVTDLWRTDKRRVGSSKVYEKETLVYGDDPVFEALTAYVRRVLGALRVANGPSHTEVMMAPNGDVVLIESAARLMGALDVSLVTDALGHNAVQLTAEAYLTPERFRRRFDAPVPSLRRRACMVQMLSPSEGVLERYGLERLRGLRTFHGVDLVLEPGDRVRRTIDSYTSPGLIFLSDRDQAAIDADYRAIRAMERDEELYLLAESGRDTSRPC